MKWNLLRIAFALRLKKKKNRKKKLKIENDERKEEFFLQTTYIKRERKERVHSR